MEPPHRTSPLSRLFSSLGEFWGRLTFFAHGLRLLLHERVGVPSTPYRLSPEFFPSTFPAVMFLVARRTKGTRASPKRDAYSAYPVSRLFSFRLAIAICIAAGGRAKSCVPRR